MEKDGIIVGYFASLNSYFFLRTFIQIDICLKNTSIINKVIEFFDQTKVCVFASELLGKYDLTVEIYVEREKQLREILYNFKEKFLREYVFYDTSRIHREFVVNWSPYDAYINDNSE